MHGVRFSEAAGMFRNMLSPTANEFLQRVLYLNPETQLFVFGLKGDAWFADVGDARLSNMGQSQIATVLSQAMLLRQKALGFSGP